MLTSKKGMSALQIKRYMGFGSYETAWSMCHKVRVALMEDIGKLGGIVEVDETFVGGLAKNRHWDKRGGGGGTGGIGSGKTPIVGAVSRKGNVLNAALEERCCARQAERAGRHEQTIGERLIADQAGLRALPELPFEPATSARRRSPRPRWCAIA